MALHDPGHGVYDRHLYGVHGREPGRSSLGYSPVRARRAARALVGDTSLAPPD